MLDRIVSRSYPADWQPAGKDAAGKYWWASQDRQVRVIGVADGMSHCSNGGLASNLAVNCFLFDAMDHLDSAFATLGSERFEAEMGSFGNVYTNVLEPSFSLAGAQEYIAPNREEPGKDPDVPKVLGRLRGEEHYPSVHERVERSERRRCGIRDDAHEPSRRYSDWENPPMTTLTCLYVVEDKKSMLVGYFGIGDSPILVRAKGKEGERILFDDVDSITSDWESAVYNTLSFYRWMKRGNDKGEDDSYASLSCARDGRFSPSTLQDKSYPFPLRHLRAGITRISADDELDALLTTDDLFSLAYLRKLRSIPRDIPFAERIQKMAEIGKNSPYKGKMIQAIVQEMGMKYPELQDDPFGRRTEWGTPMQSGKTFGSDDITLVGVSYRPGRREMLEGKIRGQVRKLKEKVFPKKE